VIPGLVLSEAVKYVAGAYIVVMALVIVYLAIMATRLGRVERELSSLSSLLASDEPQDVRERQPDGERVA
jgi:hypothetical protein